MPSGPWVHHRRNSQDVIFFDQDQNSEEMQVIHPSLPSFVPCVYWSTAFSVYTLAWTVSPLVVLPDATSRCLGRQLDGSYVSSAPPFRPHSESFALSGTREPDFLPADIAYIGTPDTTTL